VTEYVPAAKDAVVFIVKLEVELVLPEGVTDVGLRLHVIPLLEEHVSATALLNPPTAVTVTVEVAEPPGATVAGEAALAEIWKSAVVPDSTVNVSAAMCERLPEIPVTMTV
jgi:hypothetical protein